MKTKKILCVILVAAVCFAALVSCGNGGDVPSSAPVASGGAGETSAEKYTYGPVDYGEFPYAGMNLDPDSPIKVLCVETARHIYGEQQFTYNAEKEGNAINGAVQERNNKLEEQYGIVFEVTPVYSPAEQIANFIETGTYEYDVICDSVDRLEVGTVYGYYLPLDDYVGISKPWWDSEAIDMLAISDSHFLLAGAAILTDDDNTYLTLFNKDMYNTNADVAAYGNIYDIVRSGGFTIDMYSEMCKYVSHPDSSGDWGFNATYGNLSHAYGATVMVNGCGVATVTKDEDDQLHLNVTARHSVDVFDKVYAIMSDQQRTQRAELIIGKSPNTSSTYGFAELEEMFVSGRGLFYNTTSSSVSILKSVSMDFEFGVLPIPKFNAEQENYCNTVNRYQSSALAIPSNVDSERVKETAFALEALGFYNSDVIRAYYQQTLQLQAVTSDDDAEMLDIIYNHRFYDLGAIFGWGAGSNSLINLYGSVIADSSANTLISRWDAAESAVISAMNDTLDAYEKNAY